MNRGCRQQGRFGVLLGGLAGLGLLGLVAGTARVWVDWFWTPWPSVVASEGLRPGVGPVFYQVHAPAGCAEKRESLAAGGFRLDPTAEATIGRFPAWVETPARTRYFMFNLHTLRFLGCDIKRAEPGSAAAVYLDRLWHQWAASNPSPGQPSWAWSEHAAAWRAVVLGAYWEKARQWEVNKGFYRQLAGKHARFLARPSVYSPFHNHGLNNALGLLALGVAYRDMPQAEQWRELAYRRAEQQMRDNVSADGIHLEQSGLYHFYTLRSFLEIARVAEESGRSLSGLFVRRLDKMVQAGIRMAGTDGEVEGLPYSDPGRDVVAIYLPPGPTENGMPPGKGRQALHRHRTNGKGVGPGLSVFERGGYAFFRGATPDQMEIVFHTRILNAPHSHQDALGISVAVGGTPLVAMSSTMKTGSPPWTAYFHSPAAHNTVHIGRLSQEPRSRRRDGWLATAFDSYKVNRLVQWLGLADPFTAFRRRAGLDRRSLNERAHPSGGRVVSHGDHPGVQFVAARHRTFPGATHWRAVVRFREKTLLVWDRVAAKADRRFVQSFHFLPGSEVGLNPGRRGRVSTPAGIEARFRQVAVATPELCKGRPRPDPCGWFAGMDGGVSPAPALRYQQQGRSAEFLWVLQLTGAEPVTTEVVHGAPGRSLLTLRVDDCVLSLRRAGRQLRLANQSGGGCPAKTRDGQGKGHG